MRFWELSFEWMNLILKLLTQISTNFTVIIWRLIYFILHFEFATFYHWLLSWVDSDSFCVQLMDSGSLSRCLIYIVQSKIDIQIWLKISHRHGWNLGNTFKKGFLSIKWFTKDCLSFTGRDFLITGGGKVNV